MSENKLMYVTAKALIEKDGKVLVLKPAPLEDGHIDYPGGKISTEDESLIDTLKREVLEESGFEIEVQEPVYVWTHQFLAMKDHYKTKDVCIIAYAAKYKSGELKLSEEHDKHYWVNKNNYKEMISQRGDYFKALDAYFQKFTKD